MTDISIEWDIVNFRGDWVIGGGDLGIDDGGLRSAVLVSLFTWQRAPGGYVPPAGSPRHRYGWWGDTYEPGLIGSLLWTLMRSKKTDQLGLLNRARDYCEQALQWLIDDGVVAGVTVVTGWVRPDVIGLQITVIRQSGDPTRFDFAWAWEGV